VPKDSGIVTITADKAGGAALRAAALSPTAKEAALKDSVLFTITAGKHQAIARIDVDGQCKRFLSQTRGRSWISSLPVANKADDLGGVGSPDGKWIAFYSRRNGALNIWLAKDDGSSAEALTTEEVDIAKADVSLREQLAFSPDSTRIAFVMHEDLWIVALNDRAVFSLTKGQGVKALTWSPNSRWIAYVQGRSVKRIGPAGAPIEVLASGLAVYPTLSWVGDSDKGSLLFFGRGLQRVNMERKADLLWPSLLSPNRVQVQPGSTEKGSVLVPLPDGSNELFYVDFTGKTRHAEQVTRGGAEDAQFLPDGKGFLFKREGHLWRCDLDGKRAKLITDVSAWAPWVGHLAPVECN
jgi:Tol biopolymer transport system component